MADIKAWRAEEKKKAEEIWNELKLDDKDAKGIAQELCGHWDIEQEELLCKILEVSLGDKPNVQNFCQFAQAFAPLQDGKKQKIVSRVASELWDPTAKNVHGWFHGAFAQAEQKLSDPKYKKHGSFLIRFATDAGMLTINRLSEKGGKIVQAKSRLENRHGKWYCQEKKKEFDCLKDYFDARGEKGDKRLLTPVPREAGEKKAATGNMYSSTFE
jgi:hypothetical protein